MLYRSRLISILILFAMASCQEAPGDGDALELQNACIQCHTEERTGFSAAHAFAKKDCVVCHGGDDKAVTEETSHAGMTGFPGHLANAERACGGCHADKFASVSDSLMHTGRGMVDVTRRLVDGDNSHAANASLQTLGHGPADSMLRKLCASCHLGQEKEAHDLDPVRDRGGGCLACHINSYPEDAHPALTAGVSDARCFGCHSRSSRISLSYTGLAEIDVETAAVRESPLRLADGRHLERKPPDVHFTAGMTCIDCHKGTDLMSGAGDAVHQRDAVDSQCGDCHEPELTDNQPHDREHERLECATCHSQWAPQCFGCHMRYDADGSQWDHVEQRETAGRWHEERSGFRNAPGALGVTADDRVALFVPGMIMTLEHPDWDRAKFVRAFAPISPHTIGPARTCESCHRSSIALGLGEGTIEISNGEIHFTPAQPPLRDGLPADAWTSVEMNAGGKAARDGQRPLNAEEMKAVLSAPLP